LFLAASTQKLSHCTEQQNGSIPAVQTHSATPSGSLQLGSIVASQQSLRGGATDEVEDNDEVIDEVEAIEATEEDDGIEN